MKTTEVDTQISNLSVKINMKIFQQLLVDELVLYAKTLGASSIVFANNSEDDNFIYKNIKILEKIISIINNQIRKLNFCFQGTLTNGLKNAQLNEFESYKYDSEYFVRNLKGDNQLIINSIRKYLKDDFIYLNSNESLNIIAEILQLHIEMTWLFRDLLIHVDYSK